MNININTGGFGNNNYNNRYRNRHHYNQGPRTVYMINKPWQRLLFSLGFLIVGIIILIFGISSIISAKSDNFVETTATVIDYNYDHEGLAAIVVEYTVDNVKYQDTSDYKSNNPKSIGSSVEIKYNPENPEEVIWNDGFWSLLLPIMGILFIVVGAIGAFNAIKSGMTEGFNSGDNTKVRYDAFGNIINGNMDAPSRFDYSNQGQNINNPYAMNNNFGFDSSNQNVNSTSDFTDSQNNSFNLNNQNINSTYETNTSYSDFNQNNIDENNNNF